MNEIKKHPLAHPVSVEFETLDELLKIPFVKEWSDMPGFKRFSLRRDALMVEFGEEGIEPNTKWVVGFIKHPEQVDLPEWEG